MRIIAGKYRRRKLLANPGLTTRPITDYVKETVFARLADSVIEQRVADVFAGTGTIGLEALSRGATSVVFFEKDPTAVELLRRNVAALDAGGSCFCWKTDVFRSSLRPKGDESRFLPFDLIFFDPPFAMIDHVAPGSDIFRVLQRFARDEISAAGARLVLRTPRHTEFVMPASWKLEIHWPFSQMQVFVYRKYDVSGCEPSGQAQAGEPDLDVLADAAESANNPDFQEPTT